MSIPRNSADMRAQARRSAAQWSYSNQDFDAMQDVAQKLTDLDRANQDPSAPAYGYSKENFQLARQVVTLLHRQKGMVHFTANPSDWREVLRTVAKLAPHKKLATRTALQRDAGFMELFQKYKKEHPNTKKEPSDFKGEGEKKPKKSPLSEMSDKDLEKMRDSIIQKAYRGDISEAHARAEQARVKKELRSRMASVDELQWFTVQVRKALEILEDAAAGAVVRGHGFEGASSLADDNSAVASVVEDVRKFSSKVGPQLRRLR